jgi:hypothetical protein
MIKTIVIVVVALVLLPIAMRLLRIMIKLLLFTFIGRKFLKAIGDAGIRNTPDQITLMEELPGQWSRPDEVHARSQALRRCGLAEVGDYAIEEMPGVRVRLLAYEAERIIGVVYEHPQVGHWIDLVTRYADGTSITFTTSKPSGMDRRPGHDGVNVPGATPEQLFQRFIRERPRGPMKPVSAHLVATDFMRAYAEEMTWRKQRGATPEEVARVARNPPAA